MKRKQKARPQIRRKIRRKARKAKPSTAIIYRSGRAVTLNQTQLELIRDLYARDATPQEFELFMQICRSSRLDPFKKEIYCLIFSKNDPDKRSMVIITGIDGYRSTAARDYKDFGGADAATFTWFDPPKKTPAQKLIPESATVAVKDTKGGRTTATVWWEELAPRDLADKKADFWNRMPKNQLEKCAEAKGIRKRFPGRGNVFIREEIDQAMQDYTEEGRQIHTEGVAPSGAIVDPYAYAKAQQQKIVDEKLAHAHPPGSEKAKIAEATLQRVEAEDARFAAAKKVSGTKEKEPEPKKAEGGTKADVGAKQPKPKIPPGSQLITGTIHRCTSGKTSKGSVTRDVLIGNTWYKCYRTTIFPQFDLYGHSSAGFAIEAYLDKSKSIIGLKRIGPTHFQEDGATPVGATPQREPGED